MDKGKKLQSQLDGYCRQLSKPWLTPGRIRELDKKIARVERIIALRDNVVDDEFPTFKNHKTLLMGFDDEKYVDEIEIYRGRTQRMTTRKAKKILQKLGATKFHREDEWEDA